MIGQFRLPNPFFIYLRFGESKGDAPLQKVRELSRRWFPWANVRGVIVDNALGGDWEEQLNEEVTLLSGDNREREFSGYQKGLEWIARHYPISESSPIVLANDTILSSYGGGDFLRDFSLPRIQAGLALGALVGHQDSYPSSVAWEGRSFKSWIRTSLVIAKWKTWRELLPLTLGTPNEVLFGKGQTFFASGAPLDATYREFLETWLMREPAAGSPFRESWHSKEPLTTKSRRRLQEKTRCILSEQTLSLRATEKGILLLDPKRLRLPAPKRLIARLLPREWGVTVS